MFEGLFQPMHMLIILAIAFIFFGPGKLPELGTGLGKAIREFKKAIAETHKDIDVTPEPKEITSPTSVQMKTGTASEAKVEAREENTA